jgi:hypothetical protein
MDVQLVVKIAAAKAAMMVAYKAVGMAAESAVKKVEAKAVTMAVQQVLRMAAVTVSD